MTFISYAQNFEDVILWRALKHIEVGFYIDVGAQDPIKDSISRGFYEQGWRGVHVEANPFYSERLRESRPDEQVLELAVDRVEGEIAFYEIAETGLSTGDATIAREHEAQGRLVTEILVKSCPLSDILERFRDRDIHWLKVDVEGMEEAVVDGWLPSDVRPWIVVIESTLPGTQEPSSHLWESKLLSLGYVFAYFDGLNRFFVSLEKLELKSAFGAGPNVFDGFRLADTSDFIAQDQETGHAKVAMLERQARLALEKRVEEEQEIFSAVKQQLAIESAARLDSDLKLEYLDQELVAEKQLHSITQRQLAVDVERLAVVERKLNDEALARTAAEHRLAQEQLERERAEALRAADREAIIALERQLEEEREILAAERQRLTAESSARLAAESELARVEQQLALEAQQHNSMLRRLSEQLETLAASARDFNEVEAARITAELRLAEAQLERARGEEILAAEREVRMVLGHEVALTKELNLALNHRVASLTTSTSWRITAPLRAVVNSVKWFQAGVFAWFTLKPGTRPRRIARRLSINLGRHILANPKMSRRAKRFVRMLPGSIEARLRSMMMEGSVIMPAKARAAPFGTEVAELPARAKAIYALMLADPRDRKVD